MSFKRALVLVMNQKGTVVAVGVLWIGARDVFAKLVADLRRRGISMAVARLCDPAGYLGQAGAMVDRVLHRRESAARAG